MITQMMVSVHTFKFFHAGVAICCWVVVRNVFDGPGLLFPVTNSKDPVQHLT
jgi:hypothetical protein